MQTQDVILGIIASTVMLCCMSYSVSMPLAVCRLASNNVKAAEKVARVEVETVKAAGAEVIKVASAVAASAAEEDSKRRPSLRPLP